MRAKDAMLRESDFDMKTIPAWARGLRDVALAMVRCTTAMRWSTSMSHSAVTNTSSLQRYRGTATHFNMLPKTCVGMQGRSPASCRAFCIPVRYDAYASPALLSNKPFVLTLVQRPGVMYSSMSMQRCRPTGRLSWRQSKVRRCCTPARL